MSRLPWLLALVVLLAAGSAGTASAQSLQSGAVPFVGADATLIWDGITFSASNMSCSDGSTGSKPNVILTPCASIYLAPGSGGHDPSVIIEAANLSGQLVPIDSIDCTTTGGCTNAHYDLMVDLTATTAMGQAPLTAASVTVAGSATPGSFAGNVGGNETLTDAPGCTGGLQASLAMSASCTFTSPSSSVNAQKNFGLTVMGLPQGDQLAFNSVTEGFTLAPEPGSTASLVVGVIGLLVARRKKRRV